MENLKLVEKLVVVPETPTRRRRLFLSNIDLTLVAYQESVSFFEPSLSHVSFKEACHSSSLSHVSFKEACHSSSLSHVSFKEACHSLCDALGRILVSYDFLAGRLEPALEESHRLEIDCNGAGVVVVTAVTTIEMSQLGDLRAPKPEFEQLVVFLREEEEKVVELRDKPLLFLQFTQFQCGGLSLASRSNHCNLDGVAIREFLINLASLTYGKDLVIEPNPDRTIFKARNPPKITHPHFEYSKPNDSDATFTIRGTCGYNLKQSLPNYLNQLVYLSPEQIASLKKEALTNRELTSCTSFHVVAAKIWKARSLAMEMPEERISTMLFPVDVRRKMVPHAPHGFAGNALVPGFAKASGHELKMEGLSFLVRKVQEGLERMDDEYVRSGIDWLEVHRGVPCREESFSVVAWWRLGLEGEELEFKWGAVKCSTPIMIKPGLIILLPGHKGEGGINICLELPSDQMKEFHKLMMED